MSIPSSASVKKSPGFMGLLPGIAACLVIAAAAWPLGKVFPVVGGPVFAIIIGIIITTLFPTLAGRNLPGGVRLADGVKYTSKKLLQYSIILLGFEMNLYSVLKAGAQSLAVMLFTLSAAFLTAFLMGKLLKISGSTTILVGVGTSICGGSAIAATAPVIRAKDEDVSQAISTIFLFNIIAVFIFPPLGHLMGMSDAGFGMWAGTAINDTSSVVAAGTAWSNSAGSDAALQLATIVKLTRTLMIVPVTLFLALFGMRQDSKKDAGGYSFVKIFPWFVILFVAAAIVNTFMLSPAGLGWLSSFLTKAGKFMIVMAMSAIGLSTDLKKLLSNGIKPIILGLCCWFAVAAVSLITQHFMGI